MRGVKRAQAHGKRGGDGTPIVVLLGDLARVAAERRAIRSDRLKSWVTIGTAIVVTFAT